MTKLKSKKITKSTIAIIIMGIAIVALLAFGGTFAYFTSTATERSQTFTTGKIGMSSTGSFALGVNATGVMPGDRIITSAFTASLEDDSEDAYIAMTISISGKRADNLTDLTDAELTSAGVNYANFVASSPLTGAAWAPISSGSHTYVLVTSADQTIGKVITTSDTVNLTNSTVTFNVQDNWIEGESASTNHFMLANITVTINVKTCQAKNVGETPNAATLTELNNANLLG